MRMKKNTNFDSKSLMLIKKLKKVINQNDRTKEGWKEKGSCLTKMKKKYICTRLPRNSIAIREHMQ